MTWLLGGGFIAALAAIVIPYARLQARYSATTPSSTSAATSRPVEL